MLSSQQVAAMMQQQNQMFTGMQQYSQVISAQMPQAYGIGQYGMQGPMAPQFAQVPYAPRQQAGFSYGGQSAFGYGMGNQFGAAGVSALGGAGQFALGGLGMAGGLGLLGRAGSLAFDPISAGMAGYGMARGVGMGVAGGLGMGAMAAGAVAAPMMLAQHALGSMVTGAQEQSGVNQSLGQFGFSNPMSRSGRGFSRQDAMAIGGVVREMQAIPEMMTSMSELTRIMDRMGQSGMMQGVRDAGEFSKRFKETIHTLKDISKTMGSTMEEAMQAFQESKQSGFYSPQAIKQNIMQRQIVSGLTGMNQQQVNQMQQYGSEVSHQYGGSRMGGARSITRIAGELGMANQMGLLSNDRLMEMTGQEGAAGIQSLAGSLNDAGQRMGRSSLGTAMTLALGETKDGKYTGNMDQELVGRVRAGQIGKDELLRLAHQKSAGRGAKLSFAAHRQRLTTEMVNSAGVQGISMELSGILGDRGFDNPDALNLVMQRYGANEEQANQIIGLMKEMPQIQRGMNQAGTTEAKRIAEQSFMRENASWEGVSKKIGKKFENMFTEPFKKMGASLSNSIGETIDTFVDDIFGRYQTKVTELASATVLKASMGDASSRKLIAEARSASGSLGPDDLHNHSLVGGILNKLSGQRDAGTVRDDVLGAMGTGTDAGSRSRALSSLKGANPLAGKLDLSSGAGKLAALSLRHTLLTNEDLRQEGLSDEDKLQIIQKSMGSIAGGAAMNVLKRHVGGNEVDILDAIAQQSGLGNQTSMFSRKGLAGSLGGESSMANLGKRITSGINDASKGFGDKAAMAKVALSDGGAVAKIMGVAFSGGKLASAVQAALGEAPGSKVSDEVLQGLGLTQAEFDAARGQGQELVSAGLKGGANGAAIKKVQQDQLLMADNKYRETTMGIGRSMAERLSGADIGGLSKVGQGLAGRLKGLAGGLAAGNGFGDDTGDLLASLADYRGKDKSTLMGLAGSELGAGVAEVTSARSAYGHSRRGKGGDRSIDAFLSKMGLTGDIASEVRKMAAGGSSTDISASEEKSIEKYLGTAAAQSLSSGKGADQGSINAAQKNLGDALKTINENAANTAALLKGLMDAKGGK